VSEEAVAECERHNIDCLVGGCPTTYSAHSVNSFDLTNYFPFL
jgi:hypothetical protein